MVNRHINSVAIKWSGTLSSLFSEASRRHRMSGVLLRRSIRAVIVMKNPASSVKSNARSMIIFDNGEVCWDSGS